MCALLAAGCRSTSSATHRTVLDSLSWNRKERVSLATIPSSLAALTIPMHSLRNLPPGAAYTAHQGQAGLRLELKGDSLLASASCDSLQHLVYELEESLHRARSELEQKSRAETPALTTLATTTQKIAHGAGGLLLGIALAMIYNALRTRKR